MLVYVRGKVIKKIEREEKIMKIAMKKISRFLFVGAVIFLVTYYLTDVKDEKLLIAGLAFLGGAILSVIITNLIKKREKTKIN